jgi:3-oxoacyl-(acyl-carrier-protein) synthase
MKAYIRGISALSPQKTFRSNNFPNEITAANNNRFKCIEPAYTDYLNPVMARRMGRIIKMGVAAAMECLKDASVEMPGAITTGTALGCLGDTEKFLTSVIRDDEQFLTPTHFIQSLQNTVSAQIALQLKCTGHNFTFVHKGFSFESALLDALMMLNEKEADDILVGGLDEMTDHNHLIYSRLGIWKNELITSAELLAHPGKGTIAGEGSSFFVIGSTPGDNQYGIIQEIKMIYDPANADELANAVASILKTHQINNSELLLLLGLNGDHKNDSFYHQIKNKFSDSTMAYYKHWCGEYQTSTAFALWVSAVILKENTVPENLLIDSKNVAGPESILICNNYENNFSLMLITKK